MEELSLQELKEIEFDLLKYFKRFCEENGITYFLGYGTLLGAIRYNGFIPWDDDVDVLVPREDYDRLVGLFRDSERYKLFAYEKNKAYAYPFAKLCDMSTRKEEYILEKSVNTGVDIDIFPLDHWDSNFERAKREAKQINRYMFLLGYAKLKEPTIRKPIKRTIQKVMIEVCKKRGADFFIERILKLTVRENQKNSAFLGVKSWCVYGDRGICPAEAFAEAIETRFEDEVFPIPVGYDTYLTRLYGDYLPEPPKEKQITHHSFRAYRK